MENHRDSHLTDQEFTDLLLGAIPPVVQAHLAACPQCSQEAERVSSAIGTFSAQSRLWAERRAAALPLRHPNSQTAFGWLHRPQAWAAAGLALALAIGISLRVEHRRPPQQPAVANVTPAGSVPPTTLKADNDLLTAIDGELRADESATAGMYGLNGNSGGVRVKSSKRIANE